MEWLDRKNHKLISERAKKLENEVFLNKSTKPKINKKAGKSPQFPVSTIANEPTPKEKKEQKINRKRHGKK